MYTLIVGNLRVIIKIIHYIKYYKRRHVLVAKLQILTHIVLHLNMSIIRGPKIRGFLFKRKLRGVDKKKKN